MLGDYEVRDVQSETATPFLQSGREERLHELVQVLWTNPLAVVTHGDGNLSFFDIEIHLDADHSPPSFGDRLHTV